MSQTTMTDTITGPDGVRILLRHRIGRRNSLRTLSVPTRRPGPFDAGRYL